MNKYSSCCGAMMNSDYADRLICPDCKEHCGVDEIKDDMEQCSKCKKPISLGVFNYSVNSFMRKALCIACQLEFKKEVGKSEVKKTVFERMDEIQDQGYKYGEPRY